MKTLKVVFIVMASIVIVGCTVPVVVQNPDGTTKTEHQVDPRLEAGLTMVGTAGGTLPQPWGWIVSAGAAIATGISQTIAKRKSDAKAGKIEDIATTIIQGVEAAGEAAAAVKKAVSERAKTDGNSADVHEFVQKELS